MTANRKPHLASALDIEHWADSLEARGELPGLIRRLIRQTNDRVIVLDMGAGEATGAPGYDGRVEAQRGTPFTPEGKSVWEIGTGNDPAKKANEDYAARCKDPRGANPLETTFVFVTCRRWNDKRAWEAEKKKDGVWRDVRAFDVQDIETALESAPAAHIWLSEVLGKPVAGVQTIEEWWSGFSSSTLPAISPELVLAGRVDQASSLLRSLEQEPHVITISAASQDDVIAFVAAVLLTSPEDGRGDLLARTLIVRDAYSLRQLERTADLLILVPFEDELRREALLVRSHHVILLAEEGTPADVPLPAIPIEPAIDALKRRGVEEDRATALARAANRSLVAFQREAPAKPGIARRDWSQLLSARVIRLAWLAGGWTEQRSGDTDAMSALLAVPYENGRDELLKATRGPDPLFTLTGQQWGRILPEAALPYSRPSLSFSDLQAVEKLIQGVLAAIDPALDLPIEERWKASLYGKERIHSSTLRRGLATTLALLGALGHTIPLGGGRTAEGWAKSVVFGLLHRANEDRTGHLWISSSDVLPLLAEGAPDVFLREVQEGVSGEDPILRKMFLDSESGDALSVSSPHTGLLWALEGIAWSSEHLGLAAEILARLAELDPGGRLSNRPRSSLASIFRTWLPQTSAPADARLKVVDAISLRHPDVGWNLLFDLLPERHAVGFPTHSPVFRKWKPDDASVTRQEYREISSAIAQRVIRLAASNPGRWTQLVTRLSDFPPPVRHEAMDAMSVLAANEILTANERANLWNSLSDVVRKHKSFADADWAMPSEDVNRLGEIAAHFRPADPVLANLWLFQSFVRELEEGEQAPNKNHDQRVRERREGAVRSLFAQEGLEGLLRAAAAAEAAWTVGHATATAGVEVAENAILDLLDNPDGKKVQFALGFTGARVASEGWDWIERALSVVKGRPTAEAGILRMSDDLPRAWSRAAELGRETEEVYWKEFSPYGRGRGFVLINQVAERLMAHGRVAMAIDILAMYSHDEPAKVDPELAARALEKLVELQDTDPELTRVSQYDLERLLAYIRPLVDEDRVGLLEWRLLPALGPFAASPFLHRRLARDPKFFVEILSLGFKPRNREPDRKVPPAVASNAWHLLHEWKIVPGSEEVGEEVNEEKVSAWLAEARELAKAADRQAVADIHIGQVFAYSRVDEDGTWPTLPIRNAIEHLASPEVEDGLRTGTYNKRGVSSRSLTEGGRQERELAAKYRLYASLVKEGWPRTSAVLRGLADGYEAEARVHDEEAERVLKGVD